jgi:hypothetical protein
MNDIFQIATRISTPLALSGLFAAIFFYVVKQILDRTSANNSNQSANSQGNSNDITRTILKYLFILSLVAAILGFTGYAINLFKPNPSTVKLKGIVYVNGQEAENVKIRVLEVRETTESDSYGTFEFQFLNSEGNDVYTIEFLQPELLIDSQVVVNNDTLFRKYYLESKNTGAVKRKMNPLPATAVVNTNSSQPVQNTVGTEFTKEWKAGDLQHSCGHLDGENWIVNPGDDCWPTPGIIAGYSTYGPYEPLTPGNYSVTWSLAIGPNAPTNTYIGQLQVSDANTGQEPIVTQTLFKINFINDDVFQDFSLPFKIDPPRSGHKFEFRVWNVGNATVKLKKVILKKIN